MVEMNDVLGDRMKQHEWEGAVGRFSPGCPVCVRLDGNNFSKFTKGLERPFDARMQYAMTATADEVFSASGAVLAYTQSDEITLVLVPAREGSGIYHGGRRDKINSLLAARCSMAFRSAAAKFLPDTHQSPVVFDCRSFQVPNAETAADCVLWRQRDCVRNAIQSIGQRFYSHKSLHGMSGVDILRRLAADGVDWESFPDCFRFGTAIMKRSEHLCFTEEEIEMLPPLHDARKNPGMVFKRDIVVRSAMRCLFDDGGWFSCVIRGMMP